MTAVPFADNRGLLVLVDACRHMNERAGELTILPSRPLRRLLEITGTTRLFTVLPEASGEAAASAD